MARAQLLLPVGLTVLCLVAAHAAGQSSSTTSWQYRLTGGTSNYGRLEARSSSTAAWGTVCDDSFGSSDALVACRSLGLSTTTYTYRTASTSAYERGSSTQSIVMDDLACTGTESSLDRCTRASSHNCGHSEDILIGCGVSSIPSLVPPRTSWEYRLIGGNRYYGRLEVRPNSSAAWGTVCNDAFGSADALVACRSLGLSTSTYGYRTVSSTATHEHGSSSQSILMDDLACTGTEVDLGYCSRATTHNCQHSEDIVLRCGTSLTPTLSTTQTWDYRLAGGSTTHGRLEVRPNASMPWGTVCSSSFTGNDARAACDVLGLSSSTYSYRGPLAGEQGAASQPIWFGNLYCSSSDSRLEYCSRGSNASCVHSEDVWLACGNDTVPTATATWQYRLAEGGSDWGRLEVRPSATAAWGTVCDDSFDISDARTACSALGFNTTTVSYRTTATSEQGASTQPIWLGNLYCPYSGHARLETCSTGGNSSCNHAEDVMVSCGNTTVPSNIPRWEYRLVGGASYWGRLEVRANSSVAWGTVCDDAFDVYDARAACRAMGKTWSASSYRTATASEQGSSSQPIWLGNLYCTSTAERLELCGTGGNASCSHAEDVVLSCGTSSAPTANTPAYEYRLAGGTSTWGRLEVRPTVNDTWGTVCDDSFDSNDARTACASLGLTTTTVSYRTALSTEQGNSTQPIWLGNLYCNSGEDQLQWCNRGTNSSCFHSEDVMVSCGTSSVPRTTAQWEYRLVDGVTSSSGRLEIRPSASDAWGTVCDDGFSTYDANAACRALGYNTTINSYRTALTTLERGNASQPIWLGNLQCGVADARLEWCNGGSNTSCFHSEDVMLSCGTSSVPQVTTPAPTSTWEFRLVGGTSTYGRLEVRPSPAASWGTVCNNSFGMSDATVACRSLGLSTTMVTYRTAMTSEQGASSQPLRMDYLGCSGTEQRLDLCYSTSFVSCSHSQDIVVGCGVSTLPTLSPSATGAPSPTAAPWEYRLVGGSAKYGRLEVRQNSSAEWGTVCDDSFGSSDAIVACRALGIPVSSPGYRTVTVSEQGNTSQPILLGNLYCSSSYARLEECNRGSTSGCGHNEDVILDCSGSTSGSSSSIPALTSTTAAPPPAPWEYRLVGGSSTYGRLEVRQNSSVAWGAVCDDLFGENDAIVACRSLGLSTSPVAYRSPNGTAEFANISFAMDDLQCTGNEQRLDQCVRSSTHNCFFIETVLLACGSSTVPSITSAAIAPSALLVAALAAIVALAVA